MFELDVDAVLAREKTAYRPVSKFQAVRRDLAFVLPESVSHADLLHALAAADSPLVQEISVFDVYRGTGLPENMKSMAVKVVLQSSEATLTDEEVEQVVGRLVAAAESAGAQLRG